MVNRGQPSGPNFKKRVFHPQPLDLLPVLQVFAEQARAATLQRSGDQAAVVADAVRP